MISSFELTKIVTRFIFEVKDSMELIYYLCGPTPIFMFLDHFPDVDAGANWKSHPLLVSGRAFADLSESCYPVGGAHSLIVISSTPHKICPTVWCMRRANLT